MEKISFDKLWNLLDKHGVIPDRKNAAKEFWDSFDDEQKSTIYAAIQDKINKGKFVNYDPVKAIRDNAPRAPVLKIISYDEYVKLKGTDIPKDGWTKKFLPDEHRTIFIKQLN